MSSKPHRGRQALSPRVTQYHRETRLTIWSREIRYIPELPVVTQTSFFFPARFAQVLSRLTFSAKMGFPDKWLKCMNSKCKVPNSARILLPPEAQGQFRPMPLRKKRHRKTPVRWILFSNILNGLSGKAHILSMATLWVNSRYIIHCFLRRVALSFDFYF